MHCALEPAMTSIRPAHAAKTAAAGAAPASVPQHDLSQGARGSDVALLQKALVKLGFMSQAQMKTGPGIFGPHTYRALEAFQQAHHIVVNGEYGPQTRGVLAQALAHKPAPAHPAPKPAAPKPAAPKPAAHKPTTAQQQIKAWGTQQPPRDYTHVHARGVTLNRYTETLLERAEFISKSLGGPSHIRLSQGSYHKGVAASAGTHDKGGALDVNVSGLSHKQIEALVKSLRTAGFAAWHRVPPAFGEHIHAVAIGDGDVAGLAASQVQDYFNGRDGLAHHRSDPDAHEAGRPFPPWAAKYNK
jgi:hypothetical protein